MVLHSLWLCPSNNPALILPSNNRIFRRVILNQTQTKCSFQQSDDDKRDFSSSSSSSSSSSRRDFVLLGGLTSLSLTTCSPFYGKFLFFFICCYLQLRLTLLFCVPVALAGEEQDPKMASFLDQVNAYSYLYPLELPSKKFVFKWYVMHFIFGLFNLKIHFMLSL